MSWLPWLLLFALVVTAVWCFAEIGGHLRWARRALLADGGAPRPQGSQRAAPGAGCAWPREHPRAVSANAIAHIRMKG